MFCLESDMAFQEKPYLDHSAYGAGKPETEDSHAPPGITF